VIKFASRSGSMVPGRGLPPSRSPSDGDDELGEIGQSPTGRRGGGRFEDVVRLVSGGDMTTRDQTLAQLGIAHGTYPVFDEQNVVVGMVVNRVKPDRLNAPAARGDVAAAFPASWRSVRHDARIRGRARQEQFVFGFEV